MDHAQQGKGRRNEAGKAQIARKGRGKHRSEVENGRVSSSPPIVRIYREVGRTPVELRGSPSSRAALPVTMGEEPHSKEMKSCRRLWTTCWPEARRFAVG